MNIHILIYVYIYIYTYISLYVYICMGISELIACDATPEGSTSLVLSERLDSLIAGCAVPGTGKGAEIGDETAEISQYHAVVA